MYKRNWVARITVDGFETKCFFYGTETLLSYGTPIIKRLVSGELVKLWDGWTATTGRHIRAFCGLNKADSMSL